MKHLLVVMGLLVWLAGCGGEPFHLRGSKPLPAVIQQGVYLQGVDQHSAFGITLQAGLEDAGATIWQDQQKATTILNIINVSESRSVSGYSSTRQVREFIHSINVVFRVKTRGLDEAGEYSVRAERSQVYDGQYVLGTADEGADIKDQLRHEAVRLIILRLQAIKPQS
ncbi:MAG: hypothetical protein KJ914_15310 [Gammaproteobacteria bacterium]|nr:hypothetical protein [Gammaproteobacteria bacterium]MBU1723315.1 hypothetical protein [Gammaproteobacteria bacterium]MBU2006610.1 hypothetical protein [Gammaproteobacteria bacterium]